MATTPVGCRLLLWRIDPFLEAANPPSSWLLSFPLYLSLSVLSPRFHHRHHHRRFSLGIHYVAFLPSIFVTRYAYYSVHTSTELTAMRVARKLLN